MPPVSAPEAGGPVPRRCRLIRPLSFLRIIRQVPFVLLMSQGILRVCLPVPYLVALIHPFAVMDGVPWELGQLPRQQHSSPVDDIFGQPPARKPRTRKPKDHKLDTINERPLARRSPDYPRRDASTSTTDLNDNHRSQEDGDYPKKVQKGQINALAKMLSALRR
jgi:hypothetical protein